MIPTLIATFGLASGLAITYYLFKSPNPPELDLQKWWGSGSPVAVVDTSIRPFKIEFNYTVRCLSSSAVSITKYLCALLESLHYR